MARLHFQAGTRFLLDQQVYVVRQMLVEGKLLIENQSFGGTVIQSIDDLIRAWGDERLIFEVLGQNIKHDMLPISTQYDIADIDHLPMRQKCETIRRHTIVVKALQELPGPRTDVALQQFIDRHQKEFVELGRKLFAPLDNGREIDSIITEILSVSHHDTNEGPEYQAKRQSPRKGVKVGDALSVASLRRWIAYYCGSNYEIRSLVPSIHRNGHRGMKRLSADIEQKITGVLDFCEKHRSNRTVDDVWKMVVNSIATTNTVRHEDDQLSIPSKPSVYLRIRECGAANIIRRRESSLEAHANEPTYPGPKTTRILERVTMDCTPLDLFIVDDEDRLPIGRPTLTLSNDYHSDEPFGLSVDFEPAGYLPVMDCLTHGILPKPDVQSLYGTKHPWPTYGIMETLVVDNGREFANYHLRIACMQLGINLEYMPRKTPWWKGDIERKFRSHNDALIHTLPGTTFSNIIQRGDYDVFEHACISLGAFLRIIHLHFLDDYAADYRKGPNGIPHNVWLNSIQSGFEPPLHKSSDEVRILLRRSAKRQIWTYGIDFLSLRYQSPELGYLRGLLPRDATIDIKFDPGDLHYLYVFDSTREKWFAVPAVDEVYAAGLSLWKHRIIRNYVLRTKREVDIFALAEAKATIQEIVESEFRRTRRTRVVAARYLEKGKQCKGEQPPLPMAIPATTSQVLLISSPLDAVQSTGEASLAKQESKPGSDSEKSTHTTKKRQAMTPPSANIGTPSEVVSSSKPESSKVTFQLPLGRPREKRLRADYGLPQRPDHSTESK